MIPILLPTANPALAAQLEHAINNKTKPLGSLGVLESLAKQIGLIQQRTAITIDQPAILVFAADHGVVQEGVSAYPQDVTWQMVENFLAGGAAINVFARQTGCDLRVIDAGVNHDFGPRDGLTDRKLAKGTRQLRACTGHERRAVRSGPRGRHGARPRSAGQRRRLRRNGHR